MAYDDRLAARVRTLLAGRPDVAERHMFGGLAFIVAGHMCCGVDGADLILRLGPEGADEALARPNVRPMDLTGRPLRGWVIVEPEGFAGRGLAQWVAQAVSFAVSLPAKRA